MRGKGAVCVRRLGRTLPLRLGLARMREDAMDGAGGWFMVIAVLDVRLVRCISCVNLTLVMIDLSIETAAAPGVPAVGPHPEHRDRQGSGVIHESPDSRPHCHIAHVIHTQTDAGFTHHHNRVPGLCVGGTRYTVTGCSPSAEPPSAHRGRSRWGSRRERTEVRVPPLAFTLCTSVGVALHRRRVHRSIAWPRWRRRRCPRAAARCA